nr:MAG TPA: hypothetical protein [Caudoviricetes sp.]
MDASAPIHGIYRIESREPKRTVRMAGALADARRT